jgi:hypothetical protein
MTIVVVDDEPTIGLMCRELVRGVATGAGSGDQAGAVPLD